MYKKPIFFPSTHTSYLFWEGLALLLIITGSSSKKHSMSVDANARPIQEKVPLCSILLAPQQLLTESNIHHTEIAGNSNGIHCLNI